MAETMLNPCRKCHAVDVGKSVHNICVMCTHNPRWEKSGAGGYDVYVGQTKLGYISAAQPVESASFIERVHALLIVSGYEPSSEEKT